MIDGRVVSQRKGIEGHTSEWRIRVEGSSLIHHNFHIFQQVDLYTPKRAPDVNLARFDDDHIKTNSKRSLFPEAQQPHRIYSRSLVIMNRGFISKLL